MDSRKIDLLQNWGIGVLKNYRFFGNVSNEQGPREAGNMPWIVGLLGSMGFLRKDYELPAVRSL